MDNNDNFERQQQLDMFGILGIDKEWEKEWQDMPEFQRKNNEPFQRIIVNFKTREDVKAFAKLIEQPLTYKTDTIWFPRSKTPTGVFVDEP